MVLGVQVRAASRRVLYTPPVAEHDDAGPYCDRFEVTARARSPATWLLAQRNTVLILSERSSKKKSAFLAEVLRRL